MHIIEDRTIVMTLDEFRKYEVPDGWKLLRCHGYWQARAPSAIPGLDTSPYFELQVTIEKGR